MTSRIRKVLLILVVVIGVLLIAYKFLYPNRALQWLQQLDTSESTTTSSQDSTTEQLQVIATNLEIPWALGWLPDGTLLVTERSGQLREVLPDGRVIPIAGVHHQGEGGLLGLAVHPDFQKNHWLYLYLTTSSNGQVTNRVERYRLANAQLSERQIIIDNIPGSSVHDGGALAFGPDKLLYITTGDAGQEQRAQDTNSLAGKILRVTDTGTVPTDNPFKSAVYSYGHRNVQGIAWDDQKRLWATEHGRSGIQSGFDELNLIEPGKNYGWPVIQGSETASGMETPKLHSGSTTTWAPGGLAFWQGKLWFAGLRGQSLYSVDISDNQLIAQPHLVRQYGRLRAVAVGPDNTLYISTSNQDGRGTPQGDDDKILKVQFGLDKPL